MRYRNLVLIGFAALAFGCGGAAAGGAAKPLAPEQHSGKKDRSGQAVAKEAAANFDKALDAFVQQDKSSWTETACSGIADQFVAASSAQKAQTNRVLPEALYNAGLARQRCGQDDKAKALFEEALAADATFHRAKAQLALYEYQKSANLDAAIGKLEQIIRDAQFQNVEGLVSLAALQMQRGSDQSNQDGPNDLERAQKNLQRALAIDDAYMPAFNQLAVYYLEQAKAKAGSGGKRGKSAKRGMVVSGTQSVDINKQQLDLAALVASQGQRKNPNYAPIHNTTGLILVELRNYNGAVKAFGRASQLDPDFFEAHMNYAAVNLSFRGFAEAEKAYRKALKLRPNEYEVHLGLALALRGQIKPENWDKYVEECQKHLDRAKQIAPGRAETYYNEAILTQEFRSKRGDNAVPMLKKAAQQYRDFVAKAGSDEAFAAAVKRSKERTQDIDDMVKFIEEGEVVRKQQEEDERERLRQEKEQQASGATPAAEQPPAEAPAQ
jgi:tetratricopeptide (TPR) repeat protein